MSLEDRFYYMTKRAPGLKSAALGLDVVVSVHSTMIDVPHIKGTASQHKKIRKILK